ncbi:glycine cleavage system aminomethyltransferase GcvT [Desulfovirgula thermocuniculi]|uniref:glycine cleavage system aminomethyltransferase GcvT n=1 Tax=Desulfovirgula thermocuniculi TaxID=348842 RepID=UPI000414AB65|nr:glycine cleavage system aminomethyltransferase GcvT [Desulfovirgula thermocuniculi]
MPEKTPLYEEHLKLGAKMIDFSGYLLPVQYTSIIEEHLAVRERAGVFDISHMGEILVEGEGAGPALNRLLTNDLELLFPGRAQYTIMTYGHGGTVDDLIAYRVAASAYLLVVNAANIRKDYAHLRQHLPPGVAVRDLSAGYAGIALQGPRSREHVKTVLGEEVAGLPPFGFTFAPYGGDEVLVSRTGYTGEDGFEVYGPPGAVRDLFRAFVRQGVVPCGLGARDTLRFEAGLPLYGHELGEDITPVEAGLDPFIKLEKDFLGRQVLLAQKEQGTGRRLVGLRLKEKGVARQGYAVWSGEKQVGFVTTGNYAPYLKGYFALALVDTPYHRERVLAVEVRGKRLEAEVLPKNFLKFFRRGGI